MTRSHIKATLTLAAVTLGFACAAWWNFATVDQGSLGAGPVEALIVFGSPTEIDGTLTPMQTWRLQEGVAEYRRGVAPHLIFTGGRAANRFTESIVMAQAAEKLGIPPSAILTETTSRTTVENLRGASTLMQAHGWTTAEFVSSADHLPRIAVIARNAPFRWRLHPAPTPGRGRVSVGLSYAEEATAILLFRTLGTHAEPVVHAIAVCEHWLVFLPKWAIWKLLHHGTSHNPDWSEPQRPA